MTTENYWKDLYFREVEGLNNKGDPPRGLKHITQDYTELRRKINQLKTVGRAELMLNSATGQWGNVSDLLHLIEKL